MAHPILMPQVGQDIQTGFIGEWLVKEGDYVNKGDIIATIESEKATFELEAYKSGYVIKLLFESGEEAKVLETIAYLGERNEKIKNGNIVFNIKADTSQQFFLPSKSEESKNPLRIFASPSAKRVAAEHKVDLTKVKGSGPNNRIVKSDVLLFLESLETGESKLKVIDVRASESFAYKSVENDIEIPFTRVHQKIAERLQKSKQTIPHFYLFMDVDMTAVLAWRSAYNQNSEFKITVNDLIVKATATALTYFPMINGHVLDQKFVQCKDINIGIAVPVKDGLLVPVIPNVNQKNFQQINQISRKNIELAKQGTLSTFSSATFTISNLGMYNVNAIIPIINPPECAILGVGKIEKRVVSLVNNTIGIRDYMTLTLACDHRVVDGIYAAQFLDRIKTILEHLIHRTWRAFE